MKNNINQIFENSTNTKNYLLGLIILSFLLRVLTVYFIRDTNITNEWGVLVDNLVKYKSYSFYTFEDQLIPSAFMPPLYPFFLYLLKVISPTEGNSFLYLIFFFQIIFSTFSVYLFYQICKNFFSKKYSLVNSLIFSIIPINVYACGQISSVSLQIFLSLLFLKFLLSIIKNQKLKNIIIFSMTSGVLILIRGEFILIFSLIIFFIFIKKKIKLADLIKICLITLLIISPYVVRNYIQFDQIFIVKSLGYNLWKGNNELATVDGFETLESPKFKNLKSNLDSLEKNKYYEVNRDNIFLKEALNNLKEDSPKYLKLFFKRIFSYYFIDMNSKYPDYYNFLHIFPIIILSVLSFPGLIVFYKMNKFKNNCIILYLLSNLIIFSIFFILPRYKMIILPIQLILAAYFIEYVLKKKFKNE